MRVERVLHVVPSYLPAASYGGVVHAAHGLCRALVAAGMQVQVLTTNADGDGESDVPVHQPVLRDGVAVHYLPVRWPRRLYAASGLRDAIAQAVTAADVVHLHSVFLWPTLLAARECERQQRPYVLTPHGMLDPVVLRARGYWRKRLWISLFERRTLARASALHVTSGYEASQLRAAGLALAPVVNIPNGIELPDSASPPRVQRRAQLLYVGRLNWKKGLQPLLHALAEVPDLHGVIAGHDEHGMRGRLELLCEQLGIAARVRFPGPVEPAERDRLMRESLALVLPSVSENFALVVAEAMAQACPVIVSPQVGLADAVQRYGAGYVVEPGAAALALALRELLACPAAAQRMGAAGARCAAELFAWPRVASAVAGMYEDCRA